MTIAEREEEMILHSNIFKNAILEQYDQCCAVTGMKFEKGLGSAGVRKTKK